MTDLDPNPEALQDFLKEVELRALEVRTEHTFLVEGTEILPDRGVAAGEVLPKRTETLVVKMFADQNLYEEL